MTNYVLKKAATKAGQGWLRDQEAKRNGYIISAPDHDERGKKMKDRAKVEWELTRYEGAGIPAHDLKILMRVKHNAKALDAGHRIGPLKFGKASIVGLLPVVGDFADVLLAYWDVYLPARKISDGKDMTAFKSGMKVRIVCLGCVGAIPMVGDLADTIIRWNMRNAAALEKLLLTRAGYFGALKNEKAMAKGSHRQRTVEYTPVRGSEETELAPPPRYDSEYHGRRALTNGAKSDRVPTNGNARGAATNGNSGAKIGAAVGGWLGGLHGRLTKPNEQQSVLGEEEYEVAPPKPSRPTATV